jgi:hypothetical protein
VTAFWSRTSTARVEPSWQAYLATQSAIQGVGVNYGSFGTLVQDLTTQLDLLKGVMLSPDEQIVYRSLGDTLGQYQESLRYWQSSGLCLRLGAFFGAESLPGQRYWSLAETKAEPARLIMAPG